MPKWVSYKRKEKSSLVRLKMPIQTKTRTTETSITNPTSTKDKRAKTTTYM